MKHLFACLALLPGLSAPASAENRDIEMVAANFDVIGEAEFISHDGRQAVKLTNGAITLKLPPFQDGSIRFSLAMPAALLILLTSEDLRRLGALLGLAPDRRRPASG